MESKRNRLDKKHPAYLIHQIFCEELQEERVNELEVLAKTTYLTIDQQGFVSTSKSFNQNGQYSLPETIFERRKERTDKSLKNAFVKICLNYLYQDLLLLYKEKANLNISSTPTNHYRN